MNTQQDDTSVLLATLAENLCTLSVAGAIFWVIVLAVLFWFLFCGGIWQQVSTECADDYRTARQFGMSHVGLSVRAGLTAEACLQAGDEQGYRYWTFVKRQEERAAKLYDEQ